MIGRLQGLVVERGADGSVVLDVGGVGYELAIPLGSLGKLPSPPEAVILHVHTHVREDAIALFGFATSEDRAAFRTLLSVSSIGPRLALAVLSHLDARELAEAIARQDPGRFKGIPGVGKKIADRIVLELRDKLGFASASAPSGVAVARSAPAGTPISQVSTILVSMGFKPQEAERAVANIAAEAEGKSVDQLLKEALAAAS